MNKVKVSLDSGTFDTKPTGQEIGSINNRIGSCVEELTPTSQDIQTFVDSVAIDGRTFCPATFKNGKRSKENFEQQQFFALDFDNKDPDSAVSLDEVKARAEKYNLPILYAYDTFSSTDHDKFRVLFLNDVSIPHRKLAEAMQLALGTIFPEADSSCYRDVSKMYFGGKERRYYDDTLPTINVDSVFRGMTHRLQDTKGKHYKERLSKFSHETGIALNRKGLLDVVVTDEPTEVPGAAQSSLSGEISPSAIVNIPTNIIGDGENFPTKYYRIKLSDSTSKSSVTTSVNRTDVVNKTYKNHNAYRKSILSDIRRVCQLFREFESGERDMTHDELFGLATNLRHVETGVQQFRVIQAKHPEFYDDVRRAEWNRHLKYNDDVEYKPQQCNSYCPYRKGCNHGTNILSTARLKRGVMERIPRYHEEFHSIEDVQQDTYDAISRAYRAADSKVHIIKSQVGAGKSYSYLQLMAENPDDRFLIAAPTNLLKNELYQKARQMGIEVRKTPSLEEIKDEIKDVSSEVWEDIQCLYKSGQHYRVHSYISDLLKKKRIRCLEKYMKERKALKNYHGSIITTHRYLLNMDEERLREYDAIIIDEDIIFKSIIPNQEEISISELEELLKMVTDQQVSR